MNTTTALQLTGEMLKMALLIASPLLVVILVTGLCISVVQVVTQIQDPSLAFTPKVIIFLITLLLMAPWLMERVSVYATSLFTRIGQLT